MQALNPTVIQFFHWYFPLEGNLWNHAAAEADYLAGLGITDAWLPPAYKSALGNVEPGYAVYDLYDLGEFNQKNTVRTKYGTRDEYVAAIEALHKHQIRVLADIVLNHKHGGDEPETITIKKVNPQNRVECIGDTAEIQAATRFTFPGRGGKYSNYTWDHQSFTGLTDEQNNIGLIQHEYGSAGWEPLLENELGNFDYLMGNDIEYRNPCVREELKKWGVWYVETTGIDGFRLDALKHLNAGFYPEWLDHLAACFHKSFNCIGEYWQSDVTVLTRYIAVTDRRIRLFDVPLHHNFQEASNGKGEFDLRQLFDNTLTAADPAMAVTFVDNHDTQPLQGLESPVAQWFKPLAYALILLREAGLPCVFYAGLYGARYTDNKDGKEITVELNRVDGLEQLIRVRALLAVGTQRDFFDDAHLVGWTREGDESLPGSGCAVVITNAGAGEKRMDMGRPNAGKKFTAVCGNRDEVIRADENGWAVFPVNQENISVWVCDSRQHDIQY